MLETLRIIIALALCALIAFLAPRASLHAFGNTLFDRFESYGLAEFLGEWAGIVTLFCPNEYDNRINVKFPV